MSHRGAARLAWTLCSVCFALLAAGGALLLLGDTSGVAAETWGSSAGSNFTLPVAVGTFALVGGLISSRLPANPIGWICLIVGFALALAGAAGEYSIYVLETDTGRLPGGRVGAWLTTWLWVPAVVLLGTFLILLFPDGRLLSRRWRPVAGLAAVVMVLVVLSEAFSPGPLEEAPNVINPFGIEAADDALEMSRSVGLWLLVLCFLASATSMLLRYRRSVGEERQQLKWIASAAGLTALSLPAVLVVPSGPVEDFVTLTFVGLPVAVGVAILRYRLYDIDLLINRAIVYGSLTTTLAAVYLGGVVLLQYLFITLSGQTSQLAVVASTLAIAALFNPLRRAIQSFVDRRFYRQKYDATRALEEFGARLREGTDLDDLNEDLSRVVRETVAPEHVSLWLREREGPL